VEERREKGRYLYSFRGSPRGVGRGGTVRSRNILSSEGICFLWCGEMKSWRKSCGGKLGSEAGWDFRMDDVERLRDESKRDSSTAWPVLASRARKKTGHSGRNDRSGWLWWLNLRMDLWRDLEEFKDGALRYEGCGTLRRSVGK
jgi:hypothetical protein